MSIWSTMRWISTPLLVAVVALGAHGQGAGEAQESSFARAAGSLQEELRSSLAELARLREEIAAERVPLGRELSELEAELSAARAEYQDVSRLLETRTLDLGTLRTRIETQEEEARYLSNLLGEYLRELDAGLHVAERPRYEGALEAARLAVEDGRSSDHELVQALLPLLSTSLERLEEALGGARFEGAALDGEGVIAPGSFVLVGPVALFRSRDGALVGTVEQRVNSLEPAVFEFARPEDALAAASVVTELQGRLPLDPTLGNARKIEATGETLWEHVRRGGPVMVPILALAALALLVALYKWIALSLVRTPSRRRLSALLDAVAARDEAAARASVQQIRGPVGRMLAAGVEHLKEPRELIEELMYEQVLTTRLKLQRMLPFVAVSAAAAPLLGLLGTVTGIINTFKMITVFGSGDVKSLSGGISEALITTEFGLIVAIPSLLLHAFLSRKARGIVGAMESAAIAFLNQVGVAGFASGDGALRMQAPGERPAPDPEVVRGQVEEVLDELIDARLEARLAERRERVQPAQGTGAEPGEPEKVAVLVPRAARRE